MNNSLITGSNQGGGEISCNYQSSAGVYWLSRGYRLRVAYLLAVMRRRALGSRLLFFYRSSEGSALGRASNDESDLYAPVAGTSAPPPPGKGGALATRQNKNMIKPHVKGHIVCQNPNQTRTNFPTQGASSVTLSPIVSYLGKWGAWCGFSNVNKPTVFKKGAESKNSQVLERHFT